MQKLNIAERKAAGNHFATNKSGSRSIALPATNEDIGLEAASGAAQQSRGFEWSVVHGFYAAMGGFVFDLDETTAQALCLPANGLHRLTVTPRGLAVLADCDLLPTISQREIRDKSKADGLAKAIACLQATWIIMQAIVRVAHGLPVSLFEVNTIGHVICTMVIYVLWWHKLRLINEPTVIRGPWAAAMATYLWMGSDISINRDRSQWALFGRSGMSELSQLTYRPNSVTNSPQEPQVKVQSYVECEGCSVPDAAAAQRSIEVLDPPARATKRSRFGTLEFKQVEGREIDCSTCSAVPDGFRGGSEIVKIRWTLALDALERFPQLRDRMDQMKRQAQISPANSAAEILVEERAGNWPSRGLLTTFRGVLMGMALWFASIGFGAVHASAWNEYFPSDTERWFWRAASIYVMGAGLLWLAINFLGQVWARFDLYWDTVVAWKAGRASYAILGILCIVCGIAYGLARIFLVVESLVSLRKLPVQTYVVPDWLLLIPHL